VPWTHSDAVHRDLASNALAASSRGSDLRFEANGDLNQVALEWLQIEA
jgi:hypothetical protein